MIDLKKPGAGDAEALRAMLGRPVRGLAEVPLRCALGYPAVVLTHPFLEDKTPFPTVYWLTCPKLTKQVSRLEGSGLISAIEEELAENACLSEEFRITQDRFRRERRRLSRDEHESLDTGIAGVREDLVVKCLHAHLAHYLAGNENPVGKRVADLVGMPVCESRCWR